jgi:hypothetical protein
VNSVERAKQRRWWCRRVIEHGTTQFHDERRGEQIVIRESL